MPAQPVDFDAKFSRRIDENVKNALVIPFVWRDREWHLTNTVAAAVALDANEDPMTYLVSLVVPEERDDFRIVMKSIEGMDTPMLIEFINDLGELMTNPVPTQPPARSSATSSKRTSGSRSKGT